MVAFSAAMFVPVGILVIRRLCVRIIAALHTSEAAQQSKCATLPPRLPGRQSPRGVPSGHRRGPRLRSPSHRRATSPQSGPGQHFARSLKLRGQASVQVFDQSQFCVAKARRGSSCLKHVAHQCADASEPANVVRAFGRECPKRKSRQNRPSQNHRPPARVRGHW